MNQRNLVLASLTATAGKDINGPLRRHPRELDVLCAENANLRAENERLTVRLAVARDGREAALESYVAMRGAGFASKQQSQEEVSGA